MREIKSNNSKGLIVGDLVQHERGWVGRVREIEYNDADEVEVDWYGKEKNLCASRTSIIYINRIPEIPIAKNPYHETEK